MDTPARIKPVIILPPGMMSKEDIQEMRANGFCVVEAKKPDQVRFIEPPPMGYSAQEKAAISLCRWLMRPDNKEHLTRQDIGALLAHFFIQGSPLQTVQATQTITAENAKPPARKA